jgi:outer membrane murein-binding lipoprotein Lpp
MGFGKLFTEGLANSGASGLTGLITGGISRLLGLSWSPKKAMEEQLKYNKDIMALQNQYQQQAAAQSQQYAKDYWDYTNAENQAQHLKNAGLNIGLMYGQNGAGGAGASGGARQASPEQPQGNPVAMALQTQQIEQQRRMTDAQITLAEAQAKKAEEEAKKIGGVDTDKAIQEIKTMIQEEGWYKADADLKVQLRTESVEKVKEIQEKVTLIKKEQFTEEQKAKKFYEEAMTEIEQQRVLAKKWEVLNEEAIEKRINNQILQETKDELIRSTALRNSVLIAEAYNLRESGKTEEKKRDELDASIKELLARADKHDMDAETFRKEVEGQIERWRAQTGLETWENINESVDLIVDGLVEVFKALKGNGQIEINTTTVNSSPKGKSVTQSKTTKTRK